jgi:fatty-acyl-CoA synthase
VNIAGLLADGIARAGDRPALVQGDRALTYRQLGDRVGRLAAGLAALGLRRGDRVVLLMPNRPELVESLWAAFHGGFVAVPVNWHLHPDEVGYIAAHCGAAAVVVSDETAAAARALPDGVRVLRVARGDAADAGGLDYEDVLAPEPSPPAVTALDDPAPAELIQHCRDRLASFKKPREVILVPELPKNAAGKILKRELRQLPLPS